MVPVYMKIAKYHARYQSHSGEVFMFLWEPGDAEDIIKIIADYATDPDIGLTIVEAVYLGNMVGRVEGL